MKSVINIINIFGKRSWQINISSLILVTLYYTCVSQMVIF